MSEASMKLRIRAEVFLFRRNNVLADLTKSWVVFPGGGLNKGESPREAAKRESMEEAGRVVINLDVAHPPTDQKWPTGFAAKAAWSKSFCGGHSFWFTGSTSEAPTDTSHPDYQPGFQWHAIEDVMDKLKKELAGDWKDDVHVRMKVLETHLASGQKVAAQFVPETGPLLASAPVFGTMGGEAEGHPMLKTACRIFDIYDDTEMRVVTKLASAGFGGVDVATPDVIEALEDHQFGLVLKTASGAVRRRYPLHDADATKLSRAFFNEVGHSLPDSVRELVEIKIASAENVFGDTYTEQDIEVGTTVNYVDAQKVTPDLPKVAHVAMHWGLSIDGKNYFPLHNDHLVKVALARFTETAGNLEPEERFAYARTLDKRAAALGVEVPGESMVNWYTSDEVNHDALKDAIDERIRVLKTAGRGTDALTQLALAAGCPIERGGIETDASFNYREAKIASLRGQLDPAKIISTLQTIDKVAGFSNHEYMHGLLDPFAACYKRDQVSKHAAMIIDGVDLSKLTPAMLESKFGVDFVREFEQNPTQVYSSLPAPMKSMIRNFCNDDATIAKNPDHTSISVGDPTQGLGATLANSGGFVGS